MTPIRVIINNGIGIEIYKGMNIEIHCQWNFLSARVNTIQKIVGTFIVKLIVRDHIMHSP